MFRVDITTDLNDEDETGYLWTWFRPVTARLSTCGCCRA
jgi:hypothetical protein